MSLATVGPTTDFYVQPPTDDPDQVLWPVTLVAVDHDMVTGTFSEEGHQLAPETQLTVYYDQHGEFVKQPGVVQVSEGEAAPEDLRIQLLGNPVSANNRQAFRVSCAGCDISATFGGEGSCQIVDVSATGFGLYATGAHRIGDILEAEVHFQGQSHIGQVAVQSVRRMVGHMRYGVVVVDSPSGHALVKALPKLNASVQREQLRRLA